MNYYEHHIGDYAAATGHLSLIEDAVYTRMLRRYYLQEAPLPSDWRQVARLVGAHAQDELDAVEAVLAEFFDLQDDGWHQKRADADIARYLEKQSKARASADARWSSKGAQCDRNANAMRTQCERNALQTPDTSNQQEQKQKGGKPPALTLPDWLPESAWADWHAFRNSRKGWTHKARELSLSTLAKLRSDGHDPVGVIEQSIERGWTGLFELRQASAQPRAGPQIATIGKTAQAIQALEDMKHGNRLGIGRDFDGHAEAAPAIAGKYASS
ncbi:MAG: YdaU family protein [Betaproteobacteria bacterium]|nr:YdaU family protein [Betaproteobacteria bacterium]